MTRTRPGNNATHGSRPHRRVKRLLAGLLVLLTAAGVGIALFVGSTHPPAPSDFYRAPSPLPKGPPGTMIRSETLENPPEGSRGWKILYLSRGFTGAPTAQSALLFVPTTKPRTGGRNVVVHTHGTIGVASKCAGSNLGPVYWPAIDGLAAFIAAGTVVVAPDYQGLGTPGPHPYLVGQAEAWSSLDAVRAAHDFKPAAASTRFVAWGASQGGQAALFTGQESASYAPELRLAGVAVAAPATDLKELFEANRTTTFGRVLSAYALHTWSQVYPQLRLDQVATRLSQPTIRRMANICLNSRNGLISAAGASLALKVHYLRALPWEVEPWKGLLARNSPGAVNIPAPLLIVQGGADPLVRPAITSAFVERLCRQGQRVEYRTLPGVGHVDAGPKAAAAATIWILARFAGDPAASTCGARR